MAWSDVENTGGKKEKIPYTKFPEGGTRIRILDGEPYRLLAALVSKNRTQQQHVSVKTVRYVM